MGQVALGRREYLAQLMRRYGGPLLTYIQRMIGDRHRSEELLQEVFLAVWSKRKRYEFPRSFRAWVFAIATKHCWASFRKTSAASVSLDEDSSACPVDAEPSPVETAVATETASIVASAVARLPPKQRMVVVMRTWNGLPYSEIARIAGCTEATVRSHMHHGLAAMRKYLEPRL